MVLPAGGTDQQATRQGRSRAGNHHTGRPALVVQTVVAGAASSADRPPAPSGATGGSPSDDRPKHLFRFPALETSYLADLRVALEDFEVPDSARSLMIKGMPKYSNWGPYKRWCQQTGRKVWCFSHLEDFCFDAAADQLAAYLGDIRNSTTISVGCHGTLCNHRSAINSAFMCVFKCGSLSDSPRVSRLMRGFNKLKPSQPRWRWEDTAWDPGLIVHYWIDQPDKDYLTDAELAF